VSYSQWSHQSARERTRIVAISSASLEPPRSTNLELGSIVDLSDHVEEQRSPHSLVLDEREGIGLERQEVERIERTEHGANVQVARGPQVLGHRGQDRAQLLRTRERLAWLDQCQS